MKAGKHIPLLAGLAFAALLLTPTFCVAPALGVEGAAGSGPGTPASPVGPLFVTSDRCIACHNGLVTPSGEDVSIGADWRASMMAHSARDPYWHAAVRRETLDHPTAAAAIEHECSTCHMPMAHTEAAAAGGQGAVFAHLPVARPGAVPPPRRADLLAADGVSCTACHQVEAGNLGTRESFVGGFQVDTTTPLGERTVYGPFEVDAGRSAVMGSASRFLPVEGSHVQSSELCATCHTLYTHAFGPDGGVVGELPEQVPYLEWRHSAYAEEASCQSCHMPVVTESVAVSGVLGVERQEVSRHVFRGGNFFMLSMLDRYRGELGVTAPSADREATVRRTLDHLESATARLSVVRVDLADGWLETELEVVNLAGHKLPTAYPSRRVWVHLTVRDPDGRAVFESGALADDGSIRGNDNDLDPARYEPHHRVIADPDQVQIYEPILVGPDGAVTTGLLTAVRYAKDSRLLPRGFDKTTADPDVAVYGAAAGDPDFTAGGDRVVYRAEVPEGAGPFRVEAELLYQPIGFRWARNLEPVGASETDRFVSYYRSMSDASAALLARAGASTRGREQVRGMGGPAAR